jgi:hypothetical protein
MANLKVRESEAKGGNSSNSGSFSGKKRGGRGRGCARARENSNSQTQVRTETRPTPVVGRPPNTTSASGVGSMTIELGIVTASLKGRPTLRRLKRITNQLS